MVVNASNREKIGAWLDETRAGMNVQVTDQTLDTVMIAAQCPGAVEMCRGLTEADAGKLPYYFAAPTRCLGQQCVVSRTGYTGEDGLEFMIGAKHGLTLWEELARRGAKPSRLGARDTLRPQPSIPPYRQRLT